MNASPGTHGAYIRERREALGLSQADLARSARLAWGTINRVEAGRGKVRPRTLCAIAAALAVPPAELLDRAGYRAEATYWQSQESQREPIDPLDAWARALHRLPTHQRVRHALLVLGEALAVSHDGEQSNE